MAAATAILMGGLAIAQSQQEANQIKIQGDNAKFESEMNARIQEIEARDAKNVAEKEALRFNKKAKQIRGEQRVAMAGQGVSLDSGTFATLMEDTNKNLSVDEFELRNNIWKQAWGYDVGIAQTRRIGDQEFRSSRANSRNTILAGGLNAIGYGIQAYGAGKKNA